jgi:hypothetical protein
MRVARSLGTTIQSDSAKRWRGEKQAATTKKKKKQTELQMWKCTSRRYGLLALGAWQAGRQAMGHKQRHWNGEFATTFTYTRERNGRSQDKVCGLAL